MAAADQPPEAHENPCHAGAIHTRTKTKSPQTNGIVERFHKTILHEFYQVAFRKKLYRSIDELQDDLITYKMFRTFENEAGGL